MKEILHKFGFFILGLLSLSYIIFSRNFAQLCLQVPFLDFPLFVGEISLIVLLILTLCIFDFSSIKGWQWIVVVYFNCVLLKAIWGYWLWGPLAFRHAALFYYLIFIFFGFLFYKRKFFSETLKIFIVSIIFALWIRRLITDSWILIAWMIAFILTRSLRNKTIRYFFYIGLICFILFSYEFLFMTSRTLLVGNIFSLVFLMTVLLLLAEIKTSHKFGIAGVVCMLIIILVYQYSYLNASGTILDFKGTISRFRMIDIEINNKKHSYIQQDLKTVRLFNPEQPLSGAIFSYKLPQTVVPENEAGSTSMIVGEKSLSTAIVDNSQPEIPPESTGFIQKNKVVEKKELVLNTDKLSQRVASDKNENLSNKNMDSVCNSKPMIQIRGTDVAYANTLFRFFVWRDMILEFSQHKPILGFSFGKPFRSESLEIMDWAINEWIRDGWIEPHNSYLNIVYRMGIIGVALIVFLIWQFCSIVKSFVSLKSLTGILLCSTLIIFLVAGNFLPIFELPFSAIPFWALWGMTLGYLKEIKPEGRYP